LGSGGRCQLRLDEAAVAAEHGEVKVGFVPVLGHMLELLLEGRAQPHHCGPSSSQLPPMAALHGAPVGAGHL
jgi:hypothetical protein